MKADRSVSVALLVPVLLDWARLRMLYASKHVCLLAYLFLTFLYSFALIRRRVFPSKRLSKASHMDILNLQDPWKRAGHVTSIFYRG